MNRSAEEDLRIEGRLGGFSVTRVEEQLVLTHPDNKAVNTKAKPNEVVPAKASTATVDGEHFSVVLPRLSWNVIRFRLAQR